PSSQRAIAQGACMSTSHPAFPTDTVEGNAGFFFACTLCAFSWHEVTDDRDTGSGGHRPASTDRGTAPTAAPAVRGAGERDGGGVLLPQLVEAIETDLSAALPPARRMLYSNL